MHAPRFVYAPSLFRARRSTLPFLRRAGAAPSAAKPVTTTPATHAGPAVSRASLVDVAPVGPWAFLRDHDRVHAARQRHPKAYAAWTALEEARLRLELERGHTHEQVAAALGRTLGAVRARVRRLGAQEMGAEAVPMSA